MSENTINGTETKRPAPNRTVRWATFTVDMPWPPDDVGIAQASAEVPCPARFMSAFVITKPPLLHGSAPVVEVRLTFVVPIDLPKQRMYFMTMQGESAIGVPDVSDLVEGRDEMPPIPEPLAVVGHPFTGQPLLIWELPGPSRLQDATPSKGPDVLAAVIAAADIK